MIKMLLKWLFFALIIMLVGWIIPGISIAGFKTALLITVVFTLINIFIKPILMLITLPINALTLGLFTFILNALLLMLTAHWTPGFEINSFWSALLGSLLLSILSTALNRK